MSSAPSALRFWRAAEGSEFKLAPVVCCLKMFETTKGKTGIEGKEGKQSWEKKLHVS